ncbi:LPXTG cell wall anchor domain-containing protein [Allofournierella sp.]|uniref:LPXTG cell wall anchor domain-containing protein n=1 Tax=Allofournierella sp. TaxID=1940256 RepID=UPI003AB7CB82
MKQKILAAALALAMLFALLPAAAWAEELPAAVEPTPQAQQEQAEPDRVLEEPAQEPPVLPAQPEQEPSEKAQQDSALQGEPPAESVASLLNFQGNVLYTRGTAVTITANGNGIDVTYMRAPDQPETITYSGQDAVIFGGGTDEENYHQASITLNSGTVSTLYGGGHGEDESADVNEVSIVVNGGKVTNCVYGGGLNRSVVHSASIVVNNGTIAEYALGGGAMDNTFGSQKDQKPSFITALDGTAVNRTLKASVVVNGGTVNYPMGGGQNYSYVGDTRVELNGGSCIELVAGGSNGYTAESTVTVSGGSVTGCLHTVNRGAVGEAVLNLNGGTVYDLYYGWNPADQSSEGPTTLSKGGGVRTALTVYYKGATVNGSIDKTNGIQASAKVVEVKTNTAAPEAVAPEAPDADKQAKVDAAIKNAVTGGGAESPKTGSTVVTTTLDNDQTAKDLLKNPAMTAPEEGFAEIVKNMEVGDADTTLVLSKNISAVNTDDSGKITSLVFDVAPIQVSSDTAVRLASLPSALTFRLPLPADWATDYATVRHTHDAVVTTSEHTVKAGEGSSKYIELSTSTFSPFEVSPLAALTPAPKPDQGSGSGGEATPSKAVVVSLLDSTPKTGASFALAALLLAACALAGLGALSLRRKKQ